MRGELRLLQHKGVASSQGRSNLPGHLQQRVIPRGNQAANADGFGVNTRANVRITRVHNATGLVLGERAEVLEGVGDVVHVDLGLGQALARVGGLGAGEGILVLADLVGDL